MTDITAQAFREAAEATFTNDVIRAIGALARQQNVCREQDGKAIFVTGMEAAREYIIEHVELAAAEQCEQWDAVTEQRDMAEQRQLERGAKISALIEQLDLCDLKRQAHFDHNVALERELEECRFTIRCLTDGDEAALLQKLDEMKQLFLDENAKVTMHMKQIATLTQLLEQVREWAKAFAGYAVSHNAVSAYFDKLWSILYVAEEKP